MSFLERHRCGRLLLLPNPWDRGSARLLERLGFEALATTSSGFAATLGRVDGSVTLDEALAHCTDIVDATGLPVSADFENGYAQTAAGVAGNVRRVVDTGVAGVSIEDWSGSAIYPLAEAVERVSAAAEAAHAGPVDIVLTARAENHLYGVGDLADTITRLQAFAAAGADVVYAPGLARIEDVRAVVESVDVPVNVLAWPGGPTIAELAEAGVARVSVGGALAFAALAQFVDDARELLAEGDLSYMDRARTGSAAARAAFTR